MPSFSMASGGGVIVPSSDTISMSLLSNVFREKLGTLPLQICVKVLRAEFFARLAIAIDGR